jgi:hypothetical protein
MILNLLWCGNGDNDIKFIVVVVMVVVILMMIMILNLLWR